MILVVVGDVRCRVGGDWSGEAMQRLDRQGSAKRRVDGWNRCMIGKSKIGLFVIALSCVGGIALR